MDRYTRDGRFTLSPDGTVTAAGNAEVLDETGRPIHVPRTWGQRIDANGEVRAGNRSWTSGVVEFDDRSLLRKTGGICWSRWCPARSVEPTLHNNIEGSNVTPHAMVSMIEVTQPTR